MTEGFAERYGPWALVIGASDGVGAAYARAMAERGLDVILVARRATVLGDLTAEIGARTGVRTRTAAVDLVDPDAMAQIREAAAGCDVGMVMYCAGADPSYAPFLDQPVDAALALVQRNCVVPMQVCHYFAARMVTRGRGGIVLVSSGAGLVGARNMVAYGATKAFDTVMAEALWAELHDKGIDVLGLVLSVTDTPSLRRLLAARGNLADPHDPTPIPGAATPEAVVEEAIANLTNGPTWFVGEQLRSASTQLGSLPRNDAVRLMMQFAGGVMDTKIS